MKLIKNLNRQISIGKSVPLDKMKVFAERLIRDEQNLRVLQLESSGATFEEDFPSKTEITEKKEDILQSQLGRMPFRRPDRLPSKSPGRTINCRSFPSGTNLEAS